MRSALRIALIASNRHPIRQPFAGGLESHVWHLGRALAQRGHDVSLFAAAGSDPDLQCGTLNVRELTPSDAARRDLSMPAPAFLADHHAYLTLMLELSKSGADRYDLVHNHSLHYLPVAMAATLPIPMLTTVHTPPTPWLESALDASAGPASRFAAVSHHTAASWRHTVTDIEVVPNGVDTAHWQLGPGGDYLVWFGRITPEKAPHLAIAAARRAGWSLVLAGPISDPGYFATTVEPQLDGAHRYAGHLSRDELVALVGRAAAALVTPTWDEPYGLVVAEAMACGTPVVAFARGGIPEMLDTRAGRLVPPGDVAAMAAAVPAVVKLPRREVRRHAERQCSADAMVHTYLNLYREMIDTGSTNDDRILRTPSRLWAHGQGAQHRRPDAAARHDPDQPPSSRSASVHRRDPASA